MVSVLKAVLEAKVSLLIKMDEADVRKTEKKQEIDHQKAGVNEQTTNRILVSKTQQPLPSSNVTLF